MWLHCSVPGLDPDLSPHVSGCSVQIRLVPPPLLPSLLLHPILSGGSQAPGHWSVHTAPPMSPGPPCARPGASVSHVSSIIPGGLLGRPAAGCDTPFPLCSIGLICASNPAPQVRMCVPPLLSASPASPEVPLPAPPQAQSSSSSKFLSFENHDETLKNKHSCRVVLRSVWF